MKNTSIIEFNEESLKANSLDIINLAKSEGLYGHAKSVQIRFEDQPTLRENKQLEHCFNFTSQCFVCKINK